MIISRQNHRTHNLKVNDDYKLERITDFKYLGTDINEDVNSHEEIKYGSSQQTGATMD